MSGERPRRSRRGWSALIAGALALAMFSAAPATAATAGDLDKTFSDDGAVQTDVFGGADDRMSDVALQPDGKIVAVGTWGTETTRSNFALVRYNTDGSVDKTFASGGRTLTDFDGDDDVANAVAIQPDGRIVVVGSARIGTRNPDFAVARYTPDGERDTSFSGDGRLTTNWGATDIANDVAIQPDGKIVVVGQRNADADFLVARYTRFGDVDTTFNRGGFVATGFGDNEYARAVTLQSDGKIVVVGNKSTGRYSDFAVARYLSTGSLDASFDGDGIRSEPFGGTWDIAHDVAIDSAGRIVVGGTFGPDMGFMRYFSGGDPDASFHKDGRSTVDYGGSRTHTYQSVASLKMQSDGKIVAVGNVQYPRSLPDVAIVRLRTTGYLDRTFSGDGKHYTGWGGADHGTAAAIQRDGKIIAAGTTEGAGEDDADFAIARLHATTD